jgi:hypothetical protein
MSFKTYFYQLITEMVERFGEPDGDTVVGHQGNIWRFTDSKTPGLLQDIAQKTGLDEEESWDDMEQQAIENRPDIFVGRITDDNYLQNASYEAFTHGAESPLVKKIVKFYKLEGYRSATDDQGEEETFWPSELKGEYPDWAYHGTNSEALESILKYGLNPSEDNATNWNFAFSDKIYLTTRENLAIFHANNSASKQKSNPILLRVQIPDKNRITADYDVAKTYGMSDVADREGYTGQISQHTQSYDIARTSKIQKYSPKTDFTKASGVFAYKGRIPAKFIQWIGYKNNYDQDPESMLTKDEMQIMHDKNDWLDFVAMLNEHGFYDPVYLDELKRAEEDYE